VEPLRKAPNENEGKCGKHNDNRVPHFRYHCAEQNAWAINTNDADEREMMVLRAKELGKDADADESPMGDDDADAEEHPKASQK